MARGGEREEGRPGTALLRDGSKAAAPEGRAGTLLWRAGRARASALAWADPVARRLLAGCAPDALDQLRRDAHALVHGQAPASVERHLERRGAARLVARSSACGGVAGLAAVTTLEVELSSPGRDAFAWGLSPRELEVARLAAEGHGNRAIAFRLGLATPTVGTHLSRVFRKTGALDRQALTRLFFAPADPAP